MPTLNNKELNRYIELLSTLCKLSRLFSASTKPYLHYRSAENAYCKVSQADNLARSDVAIDASLGNIGIGIKTFVYDNRERFEKIAEFNRLSKNYRHLDDKETVEYISKQRNARLDFSMSAYEVSQLVYHCILRSTGKMHIIEEPMHHIDIGNIKDISRSSENVIIFNDGKEKYKFNKSKSTLYKQFSGSKKIISFDVSVLEDPFEFLEHKIQVKEKATIEKAEPGEQSIVLPLYSIAKEGNFVPERSQLNQWNASGRPRDYNEVYIPLSATTRKVIDGFLPPRDTKFIIQLPGGKIINAKVCQDSGKALMSDPNSDLGKWLLRDVLKLKEGELLTYEKLLEIGIDSVMLTQKGKLSYKLDFKAVGSYEEFLESNLT